MTYFLWACLLMLQNAAYAWVGRARSRDSMGQIVIAGLFSNGIFFASQSVLFVKMADATKRAMVGMGLLYILACTLGSTLTCFALIRLERRKAVKREALPG